MNLQNIKKSIQWVIKKIKQIKIGFHFELKIQKIKKQIFFPTFHISGSKSRINVSLAFKSDVKENAPSDGAKDDLYLKGQGYDSSGKPVNLDETFRLEDDLRQTQGQIQHRWQLTVFESGGIRIGEISSGHGAAYGEDNIMCNKRNVFESTRKRGSKRDQWNGDVTKVKFELDKCSNAGGRRECDIEIADTNCFKNKNFYTLRIKPEKTTKDLYLKGRGYDYSGKAVNFDEKIIGDGHARREGEHRWQLKRFQSGTTQLGELSGADGGNYGDDSINCNRKDVFEITEPNMGSTEDWEKPVTDIPYYLVDTDKAIRREIFEMKGI
ncbi:hypothetical protein DNK47_02050 [Mycoplasma wenyonii]|uniref:Uncharacterized protein n=1 Tax=Mycoplasma wenyonii TaxID=65123 RepID=A0A328PKW8_9MOLU|nr:hypothetical protein [Mycoplasma wenyonii]RAO95044.1 hypothetical protein DNK47_02050 [Mycoplasma wenyonii]